MGVSGGFMKRTREWLIHPPQGCRLPFLYGRGSVWGEVFENRDPRQVRNMMFSFLKVRTAKKKQMAA